MKLLEPRIYRLKITLNDVQPPVWRLIEIPNDWPLDFTAGAVRCAFGWSSGHCCEFIIKGKRYGSGNGWIYEGSEDEYAEKLREIEKLKLSPTEESKALQVLGLEVVQTDDLEIPLLSELISRVRTKFKFIFDFGDWWEHTIQVEKITSPEPNTFYPRCIAGEGADPIEDCGGAWDMNEIIMAFKNPDELGTKRVQERFEHLIPADWDYTYFSLADANKRIEAMFPS